MIHWSLSSIPELRSLSKRDRKRLFKKHMMKAYRDWLAWASVIVAMTLPFIIRDFPTNFWLSRFLFVVSFILLGIAHKAFIITRTLPHIRADLGLCTACGYDLRQSPTRCPECGQPLKPRR